MKKEERLFHATERENLESIMQSGLLPRTCFGTEDMSAYYAEDMKDPVMLFIFADMKIFEKTFAPDMPSLNEPITSCLELSEEEVWEHWAASDGTALDCLEIAGAVQCRKGIPAEDIFVDLMVDEMRLSEYLALPEAGAGESVGPLP